MRARVNPFYQKAIRPAPDAAPALAFHRALPGYAPTPLYDCPALAESLGLGGLLLKDESHRFGLNAFKALGASWALERLRARSSDRLTVAAATEGNHGRAVAWAARRLGLPAVIFLPSHAKPARVANIRAEGATVELVEGSYDDAVRRCAEASAAAGWQVVSDTGYQGYLEIPQWVAQGYATLFTEVDEQRAARRLAAPGLVLIQAGVGGLLHAAVTHFRSLPEQPHLGAVEPVSADALQASAGTPDGAPAAATGPQDSIMAGLNCGQVSLSAWPAIRTGVELFVTIDDDWTRAAMRRLARPLGTDPPVVAGETGAAGLGGLLALLQAPELAAAREYLRLGGETRVLLVITEGATDPEGYRSIV